MSEARVESRSPEGHLEQRLTIRINGSDPTFRLATEPIAANALRPVDELLLDLLDVAGAIFAADGSISRGRRERARFGRRWRRDLRFTIEVRRPEIWQRQEVVGALTRAADFLTEDRFAFAFEQAPTEGPVQGYLDFRESSSPPFEIDEVILFSGGLDSLTGAVEALATRGRRVALVTHLSASKLVEGQRRLGRYVARTFPGQVLHILVHAGHTQSSTVERTQRSRSLLFAALGHVVARMLGARHVSFYENGIVSHNLPVNSAVLGTMATRTTHPQALQKLNEFLSLLGGSGTPLENPYSWFTKAEVLQKLAAHGGGYLIEHATSCASITRRRKNQPHCGACSQCLDRRFAVLTAGLAGQDPASGYATDVLFGARPDERSRTMALDWTRHAIAVAEMPFEEFWQECLGALTEIVSGHPELAGVEAVGRIHDLHVRQGRAVRDVLGQALSEHASAILRGRLPETSLLRMYVAETSTSAWLPDVVTPRPAPPAASPSLSEEPLLPLQVAFRVEGDSRFVRALGLTEVSGRQADVAHALKPAYDEDLARGANRKNARYIPTTDLARRLDVGSAAVRQYVKRCRRELSEAYAAITGEEAQQDLLIQGLKGFRLDPDCRVVDPDES